VKKTKEELSEKWFVKFKKVRREKKTKHPLCIYILNEKENRIKNLPKAMENSGAGSRRTSRSAPNKRKRNTHFGARLSVRG